MAFIKEMKFRISSVIDNLSPSGLPEGEPERTEICTEGFYKTDGRSAEITYSELTEGGKVVSTITADADCVRVTRRGAVDSDMIFREGAAHSSLYTVAPYSFDTEVRCRKIRNGLTGSGGRLDIFYDMSIGGAEKSVKMRVECALRED